MTMTITPAHRRLEVLLGQWQLRGQQHPGFFGPAAKVEAKESFEWLHGGLFLVHRLDGTLGDAPMACIEVWEVAEGGGYTLHSFYNDGNQQQWRAREEGDVWTISGEQRVAGEPWTIRCTMMLEDGGRTRSGKWERSLDGGKTWATFWDTEATRR